MTDPLDNSLKPSGTHGNNRTASFDTPVQPQESPDSCRDELICCHRDLPVSISKRLVLLCPYHQILANLSETDHAPNSDSDQSSPFCKPHLLPPSTVVKAMSNSSPENPVVVDEWDASGCGCGYIYEVSLADLRTVIGSMSLLGSRNTFTDPSPSSSADVSVRPADTSHQPQTPDPLHRPALTPSHPAQPQQHYQRQPNRLSFVGLLPRNVQLTMPLLLKLRLLRCYPILLEHDLRVNWDVFCSDVLYPLFHYLLPGVNVLDHTVPLVSPQRLPTTDDISSSPHPRLQPVPIHMAAKEPSPTAAKDPSPTALGDVSGFSAPLYQLSGFLPWWEEQSKKLNKSQLQHSTAAQSGNGDNLPSIHSTQLCASTTTESVERSSHAPSTDSPQHPQSVPQRWAPRGASCSRLQSDSSSASTCPITPALPNEQPLRQPLCHPIAWPYHHFTIAETFALIASRSISMTKVIFSILEQFHFQFLKAHHVIADISTTQHSRLGHQDPTGLHATLKTPQPCDSHHSDTSINYILDGRNQVYWCRYQPDGQGGFYDTFARPVHRLPILTSLSGHHPRGQHEDFTPAMVYVRESVFNLPPPDLSISAPPLNPCLSEDKDKDKGDMPPESLSSRPSPLQSPQDTSNGERSQHPLHISQVFAFDNPFLHYVSSSEAIRSYLDSFALYFDLLSGDNSATDPNCGSPSDDEQGSTNNRVADLVSNMANDILRPVASDPSPPTSSLFSRLPLPPLDQPSCSWHSAVLSTLVFTNVLEFVFQLRQTTVTTHYSTTTTVQPGSLLSTAPISPSPRPAHPSPQSISRLASAFNIPLISLQSLTHTPTVWIHSFHLMLLPHFLRHNPQRLLSRHDYQSAKSDSDHPAPPAVYPSSPLNKRPPNTSSVSLQHRSLLKRSKIILSFHQPFPPSDIFRTLPCKYHLLAYTLSADVISFQAYDYARHFLAACQRILSESNLPALTHTHAHAPGCGIPLVHTSQQGTHVVGTLLSDPAPHHGSTSHSQTPNKPTAPSTPQADTNHPAQPRTAYSSMDHPPHHHHHHNHYPSSVPSIISNTQSRADIDSFNSSFGYSSVTHAASPPGVTIAPPLQPPVSGRPHHASHSFITPLFHGPSPASSHNEDNLFFESIFSHILSSIQREYSLLSLITPPPSNVQVIGLGGGGLGVIYNNRAVSIYNGHVGIRRVHDATRSSPSSPPPTLPRLRLLRGHHIYDSSTLCLIHDTSFFHRLTLYYSIPFFHHLYANLAKQTGAADMTDLPTLRTFFPSRKWCDNSKMAYLSDRYREVLLNELLPFSNCPLYFNNDQQLLSKRLDEQETLLLQLLQPKEHHQRQRSSHAQVCAQPHGACRQTPGDSTEHPSKPTTISHGKSTTTRPSHPILSHFLGSETGSCPSTTHPLFRDPPAPPQTRASPTSGHIPHTSPPSSTQEPPLQNFDDTFLYYYNKKPVVNEGVVPKSPPSCVPPDVHDRSRTGYQQSHPGVHHSTSGHAESNKLIVSLSGPSPIQAPHIQIRSYRRLLETQSTLSSYHHPQQSAHGSESHVDRPNLPGDPLPDDSAPQQQNSSKLTFVLLLMSGFGGNYTESGYLNALVKTPTKRHHDIIAPPTRTQLRLLMHKLLSIRGSSNFPHELAVELQIDKEYKQRLGYLNSWLDTARDWTYVSYGLRLLLLAIFQSNTEQFHLPYLTRVMSSDMVCNRLQITHPAALRPPQHQHTPNKGPHQHDANETNDDLCNEPINSCGNVTCICMNVMASLVSCPHCSHYGYYYRTLIAETACIKNTYGDETIKLMITLNNSTNSVFYAHSESSEHHFNQHRIRLLCPTHKVYSIPWCFRSATALFRASDVVLSNTFWDGLALTPLIATTLTCFDNKFINENITHHNATCEPTRGSANKSDDDAQQQQHHSPPQPSCVCSGCQLYRRTVRFNTLACSQGYLDSPHNPPSQRPHTTFLYDANSGCGLADYLQSDASSSNTHLHSSPSPSPSPPSSSSSSSSSSSLTPAFLYAYAPTLMAQYAPSTHHGTRASKTASATQVPTRHSENLSTLDRVASEALCDEDHAKDASESIHQPGHGCHSPLASRPHPTLPSHEAYQAFIHHLSIAKQQHDASKTQVFNTLSPSSYYRAPPTLIVSEFQGSSRSVTGIERTNPLTLKETTHTLSESLFGPTSSNIERQRQHRLRYHQAQTHSFDFWINKCLVLLDDVIRHNTKMKRKLRRRVDSYHHKDPIHP